MVHNPAKELEGKILEGGWKVGPLIQRNPAATGGNFCQCYKVFAEDGKEAFLKALDFHQAFPQGTEVIQMITTVFNFESELLRECSERNMDRVVKAIGSGTIHDPSDPVAIVPYLIFEAADADVRVHLDAASAPPTVLWKLRLLHHVATGLKQLHGAGIAHQDLKPSNVLIFTVNKALSISKISDLGRASRAGHPSPHDGQAWAGDRNYAPPEVLYSYFESDWTKRRISADLYMLGGLVSFVFSCTTSIATLMHELPLPFHPGNWGGTFDEVLPYLVNAFAATVDNFANCLPDRMQNDLLPIFKQLCHPDPRTRGFPGTTLNKNALEKYLSVFDRMALAAYCGRYANNASIS